MTQSARPPQPIPLPAEVIALRAPRRRRLAVLAADVIGFSREMAQHPEATLRRLEATRAAFETIVRSAGGSVHDLTGDAMVAVFESPDAAATAALAIQSGDPTQPVDRLPLRVGLHVDDALTGGDGRIYGNAINVAARMQEIAQPGGIAASAPLVAALEASIAARFVCDTTYRLKNLPDPVVVHRSRGGDATQIPESATARLDGTTTGALSLVVLPFATLRDDEAGSDLADAVTAEVIRDLARLPDAFVIARATAMTYRDRPVDPRGVCRELDVRFALVGTVTRREDALVVDAELIEGATGRLLWSEQMAGEISALGDLRDRVIGRLARAFGVRLVAEAGARAEKTEDASVTALRLRALSISRRAPSDTVSREASALFREVLEREPDDPVALSGLAVQRARDVLIGTSADPAAALNEADELSARALKSAPFDAELHYNRALVCLVAGRWSDQRDAAARAIELDRNLAPAYLQRAIAELYVAAQTKQPVDFESLHAMVDHAVLLSPRDPQLPVWIYFKGTLRLFEGRLDEAIALLRHAIDTGDRRYQPWESLVVAYSEKGDRVAAAHALSQLRDKVPHYTIAFGARLRPDNGFRERLATAMRALGVGEH